VAVVISLHSVQIILIIPCLRRLPRVPVLMLWGYLLFHSMITIIRHAIVCIEELIRSSRIRCHTCRPFLISVTRSSRCHWRRITRGTYPKRSSNLVSTLWRSSIIHPVPKTLISLPYRELGPIWRWWWQRHWCRYRRRPDTACRSSRRSKTPSPTLRWRTRDFTTCQSVLC